MVCLMTKVLRSRKETSARKVRGTGPVVAVNAVDGVSLGKLGQRRQADEKKRALGSGRKILKHAKMGEESCSFR